MPEKSELKTDMTAIERDVQKSLHLLDKCRDFLMYMKQSTASYAI